MISKKILNLNKTIITIIFLNTIQIGAATGIILYDYMNKGGLSASEGPYGTYLIGIIIIAVISSSVLTIKDVKALTFTKRNPEYEMLKASLEQVENLNKTLRGQRHDFLNHLQVVYGLMDMGEYDEANDYIEKVFNDIQRISRVLKTANPAVNALLQAKVLYCEKRNIRFEFYITSRLASLKVPSWEFCRVLGNIIDNSIYALQQIEGDRLIELSIYEDLKNYGFKIKNNGPIINKALIDKIFEVGFTTKGEMGEGMGLAISREILETYGGAISVVSDDGGTVFEGWVSKL